jgi:hypothetical protein
LPGTYKESFWRCSFSAPDDGELELFIARVIEQVAPALPDVLAGGGKARLFIGIFLEHENIGLEFSPEFLGQCGSLGISLGFDVYGPDPSESTA